MNAQIDPLLRFAGPRPAPAAGAARRVVLVAAGKGGVGCSAAAALLACAAAAAGRRALLVEAVAGVETMHLLLGTDAGPGIAALRGGASPRELVAPFAEGIDVVVGGAAGEAAGAGVAERGMLLRRLGALYESYDLVVVDAGSRLDTVVPAALAGAGRALLVTAPDRIAAAASFALVKALRARAPALDAELLVNRAGEAEARSTFELVRLGAERFLQHPVGFAGAVPDDARLRDALAAQGLAALPPDSAAALAVQALGDRILDELDAQAAPDAAPHPHRTM